MPGHGLADFGLGLLIPVVLAAVAEEDGARLTNFLDEIPPLQAEASSASRRTHGKTVVIEPTKPKGDAQGGTHASPRWHERRGHWRTMKKTGKKVWVKNCEVGDKTIGAVFHDYKLKEKNT